MLSISFLGIMLLPAFLHAQDSVIASGVEVFQKAKVLEVSNQGTTSVVGTDTVAQTQSLKVEILDCVHKGDIVTFENDYIQLTQGDIFYARYQQDSLDGTEYWSVSKYPYFRIQFKCNFLIN